MIEGSRPVPIATRPPGCISFLEIPLWSVVTLVLIGSRPFLVVFPGLISIESPILIFPFLTVPPRIPPLIFLGIVPGLFMSNDLAISIWKSSFVFFSGVGNKFSITSINKSIFLLW